ncbi:hypothetical protein DFA_03074 [Cavenderia fasciculata]|uniref:ribonuclease Z n=1 Tax=Cavenderia fasciculata TaxID=261658 RepID=F4PGJ5_CACFS|nr:uncharacterized protein DFA_03074 [Cavenderia fasciculata]EGG24829.1 hypothetical protein DFA_03074 [Cavenderia fasciculata]|eukprot:XP_004362680.1 hypothetical protein DFA_03074 [Cavenderia fasciculata]
MNINHINNNTSSDTTTTTTIDNNQVVENNCINNNNSNSNNNQEHKHQQPQEHIKKRFKSDYDQSSKQQQQQPKQQKQQPNKQTEQVLPSTQKQQKETDSKRIETEKMKAGVKILSSGGGYTDPSIVIISQEKKYVFNLGNGINRQNTKNRFFDSNHLFLTHFSPSTMTDFPNYLLRTRSDFSVVGPSNTSHAILSHRYYIGRGKKSIHITECTPENDICLSDENVSVYPIVLKPSNVLSNTTTSPTPLKQRKKYNFIHQFKKELASNNQFKLKVGENSSQQAKSFYDWTLLRGSIVHSYSGHPSVTTYEIDQYLVYQLMKLEQDIKREDRLPFRPANYKDIKAYLYGPLIESDQHNKSFKNGTIRVSQQQDEFFAIESRHFRLIRRIDNITPITLRERHQMMKMRAKKFTEDKVFGPVQSHVHTLEPHRRNLDENGQEDIVGKFDNQRAIELGVPAGPLRAKICKGQPVTTANGTVVTPDQVMSPSVIGPAVLVISIPHRSYLQALLTNPTIQANCFEDSDLYQKEMRSGLVCHMVSEELINTPEYTSFINKFGSRWRHLLFNDQCAYHELTVKSAQMTNALHEIAPTYFHPLHTSYPEKPITYKNVFKHADKVDRARFQHVVFLNPLSPIDQSPVLDANMCTESVDTSFSYGIQESSGKELLISSPSSPSPYVQQVEKMIEGLSRQELEIVFLGTGCSQSSEYRDETCIYLDLFEKGGIMMDVGGGSYSQMFRKYGEEVTTKKLAALRFIFISHMHTDHHEGIQKILEMRHLALDKLGVAEDDIERRELAILSQSGARFYISEIHNSLTLGKNLWSYVQYYRTPNIHESDDPRVDRLSKFLKKHLSLESFKVINVIHSFGATGIEIKSTSGWSVAYSGDTAFCPALYNGLRDVTVFIHEATFTDDQHEFAKAKSHCTFGQAIETSEQK